jgi:hypothetical protein
MRFVALLVTALLLLAACTGAPPQTQPTARATPAADTSPTAPGQATPPGQAASPGTGEQPPGSGMCALLPETEVSQIVGKPATVAEDQSSPSDCTYNVGDPAELIPDYVFSVRTETGDFTGPKAAFPGGQDITGVGDAAYWAPSVTSLWFSRAGQMYVVQLILFSDEDGDPLQIAQGLAQLLLSNL